MSGKFQIITPDQLTSDDRQRWLVAQAANPIWNSPFLHPSFTQTVYQDRPDTRILIAEDENGRKAWLGFHQLSGGLARPVGAPVSDHQGMVQEAAFSWQTPALLQAAGIGALPFSGWSGVDDASLDNYTHFEETQLLDLSNGPQTYFETQQKQHHKYFKKMRQRARAVQRDHNHVEFVADVKDLELFELLLKWKHEQYTRTGKLDVLDIPWVHGLLNRVHASTDPGFRAVLFGYRMDGEWAAAELGLLAGPVYHSWIAAYDARYSRCSPGLLLLHGVIDQATEMGITQIDLGRGHDHYKKYYTSNTLPLAEGCFVGSGSAALQRKVVYAFCDGFGKLPLGKLASFPGRVAGSLDYIGACHPKRSDQINAFGGTLRRMIS